MTTANLSPVPLMPDSSLYADYFKGLRDGRLVAQTCTGCGALQWPPRELCGHCQSSTFEPVDVPTEGLVYTYSVMYRAFHRAFADKLPYGVVVVEVADGVRFIGRYAGPDPESIECGQRMEAVFDDLGPDSGSVAWRRAEDPAPVSP
ncbi:hypothetical protein GCM10023215_62070 [Pseudonocardia yuanmonensis]|uniref:OB-fold protein n=1 Tax=Pseudonocardia yuanmonensis TaxID=1095914 RepID=A0ABP8XMQ6_9PSEU